MTQPPPPWLHRLIVVGIQKLYTLSLEGTPAHDVIAGTALAWGEAFMADRVWNEALDADRIEAAFSTLARTRERWPAPIHLLLALRPREPLKGLPKPAADPARAARAAAEVRDLLQPDRKKAAAGDDS